ncbi:MAG: hypothetical protein ACRDOD_03760 [Streptosporangiaceae bacterium]
MTEGKSLIGQRVTSAAGNLRLGPMTGSPPVAGALLIESPALAGAVTTVSGHHRLPGVIRGRGTAQPGAVILDATIGTSADIVGLLPRVARCSAA